MGQITSPIVIIASASDWQAALKTGTYTMSTVDKSGQDVGFLHGSFPNQTIGIANRHYAGHHDLVILLIDPEKVTSPVKYEGALSGRPGTFPHIYGPLNTDAVILVSPLAEDANGHFVWPAGLSV
ncbi:MAG TPA: DUF952 domain-containing protein [Candidatus Saccharimonadia bacterium]|nr:DUF952 domain-containing protein [Candidatus Saccharimonadia bacterium]